MMQFLRRHKVVTGLVAVGLGLQQVDTHLLHDSMFRSLRVLHGAVMTTLDYKFLDDEDIFRFAYDTRHTILYSARLKATEDYSCCRSCEVEFLCISVL